MLGALRLECLYTHQGIEKSLRFFSESQLWDDNNNNNNNSESQQKERSSTGYWNGDATENILGW